LYSLALKKLELNHNDWYKEIHPFVTDVRFTLDEQLDEVRRIIKFFLARYGAYEEFLNFKSAHLPPTSQDSLDNGSKGIWQTVKGYAISAKNKVAGWFGLGGEQSA
jgi:hypothetical protein